MAKGILISFEGMEGAGKTTQCDLLANRLKDFGKEAVVVREPGGVPIAEKIRDLVLDPDHTEIALTTEVLLFQAARAQLYKEIVLPSLRQEKAVLMDRTRDSSTIYQGIARGVGVEIIENLNDYSTQNTVPDLTFLLDLPAEIGLQRRIDAGVTDRIEREGIELQRLVCKAYLDIAKKSKSGRWVVLDGLKSIDDLANEVWSRSEGILKERGIV